VLDESDLLTGMNPDYEGEKILTTEIDPEQVPKGKYDLDVAGHYARPDIFRLYVNERPQTAAVFSRGDHPDPFVESD
jgi:nitrilase